MRHMQSVPWQVKIAAKLVLARLPLPYSFWEKIGLFKQGKMEDPGYALGIFRRHFDSADFARKSGDFVGLEIGPGDSLCSALMVRTFGGAKTYLVDAEHCATNDVGVYQRMEEYLRGLGMHPPNLENCKTIQDVAQAISAEYLTEGLASLKKIPSGSVDFIWSHAVLPYVRRAEFAETMREMRRIQRPDGVGSHTIPIKDVIGGNLNDLRFSEKVWESDFMSTSRFYTNRLRYAELLEIFRQAGFKTDVVRERRWEQLPTPRNKMSAQFAGLPEEDLLVEDFDVLLR
jgi:SAM-dependent methyltransferase